jgi:prepilin-type N-terminal cleavage/methylation domain-containing protein/prepilin-type processing-associated H-X9-DG protein
MPAGRPRGFSLIELLVVIGIIGILIALLMPALHRARQQAWTVKCAAQLHELGQGLSIYAAQNKGALPTTSFWHIAGGGPGGDGTGEDSPGLGWTEELAPCFASPLSKVYECPAFPEGFEINYFLEARWARRNGRQNMLLSQIRTASLFVLSGDCTGGMLYHPWFGIRSDFTTTDCDKDDALDPCLTFFGDSGGGQSMHHGGNNILFADGHVQWARKFDPQAMTFHPVQMQAWKDVTIDQQPTTQPND